MGPSAPILLANTSEDAPNQKKTHDNLPSLLNHGESGENSMCTSRFVTKLLQWRAWHTLNIKDSQPLRTKHTDFSPSSCWNKWKFPVHFPRKTLLPDADICWDFFRLYTVLLILGMLEIASSKTIKSLNNLRLQNCCTNTVPICRIRPHRKSKSFKQKMTPIKLKESPWRAHMFIHFRAFGVLPSLSNWLYRLDPWAFSTQRYYALASKNKMPIGAAKVSQFRNCAYM